MLVPVLRCDQCGREARNGTKGWVALRADDPGEDPPEIAVPCRECVEREFGEPDGG